MWFQLFEGVELTLDSVSCLTWRRCPVYRSGCAPTAGKGPRHREGGLAETAGDFRLGVFLLFLEKGVLMSPTVSPILPSILTVLL